MSLSSVDFREGVRGVTRFRLYPPNGTFCHYVISCIPPFSWRTLRDVNPRPPCAPTSGPGVALTERRKAATQLDIARAACALFAEHGPDGTTAEDIARRAGVALRTFYRYFRSKQDA